MASLKPSFARFATRCRWLAYAAAVTLFLLVCAQFYLPGQGFSSFAKFSGKLSDHYVPELRRLNFYEERDTYGYDAQYYAQIAIHPELRDPELREAVDSLPYRARRILFCWSAYVLGAGNPAWVLQVFCLENVVAWLLLGWVLLRWFPPSSWGNFVRWFGVMFTFGLCFSVRGALVDGPSLLLIALAMALLEKGRPWWSAALLGIAGLGKETNVLGAAVLAPANLRDRPSWLRALGRGALVAAPLLGWLICLKMWLGKGGDVGARNFDWPFVGYVHKWQETWHALNAPGNHAIGRLGLLIMIAMTVQWLYFAARPRWSDPWWRLGASYAALMVVLGDAVWEGFPGAASRVLLPMTLAFNVSLPRARKWWLVLIVGNLLVLPSADTLVPPGREDSRVLGPHEWRVAANGDQVDVSFTAGEWYGLERSHFDYWRWSRGLATIVLHNPHAFPIAVDVTFKIKSSDPRNVTLRNGGSTLWQGPTEQTMVDVALPHVVLPPGDTVWTFDTDRPAANPPNGDLRKVAFRICDLQLRLAGRAAEGK